MLLIDDLADLVLARRCLGCDRLGRPWCDACLDSVRNDRAVRQILAVAPPVVVVSSAEYDGTTRQAIIEYKERGLVSLAAPLAYLLADAAHLLLTQRGGRPCAIVGVPSHRRSRRGFDALGVVARKAVRILREQGHDVVLDSALYSRRDYTPLKTLGRVERARQVADAFGAKRRTIPVADAAIVVDDVITTGATVAASTRVLRAAGRSVLGIATIAATAAPGAADRTRVGRSPGRAHEQVGLGRQEQGREAQEARRRR